jgi:hypothetical protein
VLQIPGSSYTIGGIYGNNRINFSESLESTDILSFIVGYILPVPTISTTLSKASGTIVVEDGVNVTVSTGATLVNLAVIPISYTLGEKQLMVFVDGVYQSITSGAYTETNTTSITLAEEVPNGTVIDIFKIV